MRSCGPSAPRLDACDHVGKHTDLIDESNQVEIRFFARHQAVRHGDHVGAVTDEGHAARGSGHVVLEDDVVHAEVHTLGFEMKIGNEGEERCHEIAHRTPAYCGMPDAVQVERRVVGVESGDDVCVAVNPALVVLPRQVLDAQAQWVPLVRSCLCRDRN